MDPKPSENTEVRLPFFRRNNPFIQNCLISGCLFANPGLYLAVTLLGAGGGRPSSISMADTSNGVLYGLFTFSAIGAGTLLNIAGPRLTTLFAITGYPIYIGAMWYFDVYGNLWYPILAGAYLGITAGCLWTTAAYMANSYPEEKDKGLWRAMQWISNVSGAAVGASVALGINWNATSLGVPYSVYIIFIILQCCSMVFALLMLPPDKLVRSDGTAIALFNPVSIKESLYQTAQLFTDWRVMLMLPTFLPPEMFFPFQASMNAYAFNLRTRTLNSLLNNLVQIPVTFLIGYILDSERFGSRKRRAFIAITFDAVWITGTYIAQTIWLASWKFDRSVPGPAIDVFDAAYGGAVVIYMFYAAQYGVFQNVVLWILGTLTNDPHKTAAMGGLFVGVLSAGTAISFGVDATATPYDHENAYLFALATICWPILFYVAYKYTTNTNYLKEENVVVPLHILREMELKGKTIDVETNHIPSDSDNKTTKIEEA